MRLVISAVVVAVVMGATLGLIGCPAPEKPSSDEQQRRQQEVLLQEATHQTGMPDIKNFRERKILKDILELRDQEGLTTYTYVFNELNSRLIFIGESVGYGIPYATQYTSPQKVEQVHYAGGGYGRVVLPQADPNGLFSPAAAEGTWILLKDPNGKSVKPVYIEPRVIVSPFPLKAQ